MYKEKKIKYRYFFLSFSLAFLGLSLLFFLLLQAAKPGVSRSADTLPSDLEATVYLPSRDEALSVLFVGVEPDSSDADTFLLARFDPSNGRVPIVVFPRETAVDNNGKTETLEQVYRYGGADYTRTVLSGSLGVPIDRFVRMDVASFVIAAGTVGTVEFTLREELTLAQDNSAPLTLGAGIHLLDGRAAADILHHRGYSGGELTRCAVAGELTAAIVNQRMDIALSTMVDKVFEKIVNLIDTDITYLDYENRKEAAAFLAKLGQEPAVSVQVEGGYSSDGKQYTLSDTFIARLTQLFVF